MRNTDEDFFSDKILKLESKLDKAIFELFDLNQNEIDLIKETCNIKLDLLYNNQKSKAIEKLTWNHNVYGLQKDLELYKEENEIKDYLFNFLRVWNQKLSPAREILWQILFSDNSSMMGFIFYSIEMGKPIPKLNVYKEEWNQILNDLSKKSLIQNTKNIYTDGITRVISEQYIFIAKRNERRLWTKNTALEDAEALLVQAIHKQREFKK